MKKIIIFTLFFSFLLTACSNSGGAVRINPGAAVESGAENNRPGQSGGGMMGRMMGGMMGGMMSRHMATIPNAYAGRTNPVLADEESIKRGQEIYTTLCVSCHGETGLGEGPAGAALEPAPAPVAHTSQMMGDDYLFWRISEGGAQFESAMPAWKNSLEEGERWDVINYIRALGSGGRPGFNEAAMQAEMLAQAIEQGVITEDEAGLFKEIHDTIEQSRDAEMPTGNAADMQNRMLSVLIDDGTISQAQADQFLAIRAKLLAVGLSNNN